ncbi:fucolectin-like [Ylistrum balloti]|uniref:fucolectin-like n=1 Tax=Ylistrum balloti TaxID=509963 RepID=UPI002905C8D2|nr:fucolectin-like [Ylistrum balloti]
MLFVLLFLSEFRHNHFHGDNRFDNILPSGGITLELAVPSLSSCAQECFYQADCVSVFYKDKKCIGWNTRTDDLSPTSLDENMQYYELKGVYGNVAEGKPAVQSSTFPPFSGIYSASKAVDGSRYPVAVKPDDSCSCTNKANSQWWRVDLLDTFLVTDVAVLKRKDDADGITLVNVSIGVSHASSGPFTTCYSTGTKTSTTRFETFTCQTPVYGRYVKLSKLVSDILCLCEVEIYVQD